MRFEELEGLVNDYGLKLKTLLESVRMHISDNDYKDTLDIAADFLADLVVKIFYNYGYDNIRIIIDYENMKITVTQTNDASQY